MNAGQWLNPKTSESCESSPIASIPPRLWFALSDGIPQQTSGVMYG